MQHPNQPSLPGPELVLLRGENGDWVWTVANDVPVLSAQACQRLQMESARYRARLLERN